MGFELRSVLILFVIATVWTMGVSVSPTVPVYAGCKDEDQYLCQTVVGFGWCNKPFWSIKCELSCLLCKPVTPETMTSQSLSRKIAECVAKTHPKKCSAYTDCYHKAIYSFPTMVSTVLTSQLQITTEELKDCRQTQKNLSSSIAECLEEKKKNTGIICHDYVTCFHEATSKFLHGDKSIVDTDIVTALQDHFLCQKAQKDFIGDMDVCIEKSDSQTCGGNLICYEKMVKLAKYKHLLPTFKSEQLSVFLGVDHNCTIEKECVDSTGLCESNAKGGYCVSHRQYMYTWCRRACGVCNCKDSLLMCPHYATLGECETNSVIATWCRVSCNTCGAYIGSNLTDKATDNVLCPINDKETRDPVIDFQESLELGRCVKQGTAAAYGYHCRKSKIAQACATTHPDPDHVRDDVMTLYKTDFTQRDCVNVLAFENDYLQCVSNKSNDLPCGREVAKANCLQHEYDYGKFGHLLSHEHRRDLTHFQHDKRLCLEKLGNELVREAGDTCMTRNYTGPDYLGKCYCFDKVKGRQQFHNMDSATKTTFLLSLNYDGKACTQGYELSALIERCAKASRFDPNNTRNADCFKQIAYDKIGRFHLISKTKIAAIRMKAFRTDRFNKLDIPCADKIPLCPAYMPNGACTKPNDFLEKNCRKSCHYCFDNCYDTLLLCAKAARNGLCAVDKRIALRCRKTCKTCGESESSVLSRMKGRIIRDPVVDLEVSVVDSQCMRSKVKGQFYDICQKMNVAYGCTLKTDKGTSGRTAMLYSIQEALRKLSRDQKCIGAKDTIVEKCYAKKVTLKNVKTDEKNFDHCLAVGFVSPNTG